MSTGNVLIFGMSGQDAHYLKKTIEKQAYKVIGVSRSRGNWLTGNVADFDFVRTLVKRHKPEYIFHLAANSTTRHEALFENHETISTGSLNILESAYLYSKHSKIFLSGSGLQFVNNGEPISENDPFAARNPYCIARIQSAYSARYYRMLGLKVYVGYFFNHDSPLRSEAHVNQKVVKTVQRILNGSNETLELGDLSVRKEFTFAGDVAEAIWVLIKNDLIFEAVIGSGLAYSIQHWIEICFSLIGKEWQQFVKEKTGFVPEYQVLVSRPNTIFSLDWHPKVDVYALAKLMIEAR